MSSNVGFCHSSDHGANCSVHSRDESSKPSNDPILHIGPASQAFRIAVKCRSDRIPGEPSNRLTTMGNLICQHQWGRDMDTGTDFIRTDGFPQVDGERVRFLLDTGMMLPDTKPEDITILVYSWNGETMYVMRVRNKNPPQGRLSRQRAQAGLLHACMHVSIQAQQHHPFDQSWQINIRTSK